MAELKEGLKRYFAFYNEHRFNQSLRYRTLDEVYGSRFVHGQSLEEAA